MPVLYYVNNRTALLLAGQLGYFNLAFLPLELWQFYNEKFECCINTTGIVPRAIFLMISADKLRLWSFTSLQESLTHKAQIRYKYLNIWKTNDWNVLPK